MICNESAHLSPAELTWLISSTWLNMHLINTGCHHWYLLCDYRAWITTIMKHLHTMQSLIENHLLICKILSPPTLWQNNFIKHDIKCLVQIFLNLINCLERESNIQQFKEIVLRKLMKYFAGGARSARYRPHGYKPPPTRKMSPASGGPVRKSSADSLQSRLYGE